MAIKKYLRIKGWDVLDSFFEKEVKGIHMTLEKSFGRAFCRCGETIASDGSIHKCPKCGNIEFEEYGSHYYCSDVVTPAIRHSKDESMCPTSYKIYEHRIFGDVDAKREVITFTEDNFLLYEFLEREIIETKAAPLRYSVNPTGDNLEEYIKAWPHFSKIEKFLKSRYSLSVSYLKDALEIFNTFEKTVEDDLYIQYPDLGLCIISHLHEKRAKFSFRDNLPLKSYLKLLDVDDEFLNVYNEMSQSSGHWRTEGIFEKFYKSGSSWRDEGVYIYKELQSQKDINSIGYELIVPYIKNGVLSLKLGLNLIKKVNGVNFEKNDFLFGEETMEDLFRTYLKENIIIKGTSTIVDNFFTDIDTLQEMKIPITKENLKLKNMNYFLNKERLSSTYRIPEDKAECFVDLFEKDPLKAIELLENRRKMTKKQLDSFINEMTN